MTWIALLVWIRSGGVAHSTASFIMTAATCSGVCVVEPFWYAASVLAMPALYSSGSVLMSGLRAFWINFVEMPPGSTQLT